MGWGLSEGQWPQLAMEGPVMNVQRQSRTLQQKRHQFSSRITAQRGGRRKRTVECVFVYVRKMCVPRNSIEFKKVCCVSVRVCVFVCV